MARCCVTYVESTGPSPSAADRIEVALGPPAPPEPPPRGRRATGRRFGLPVTAGLLAVALGGWALWPSPASHAEPPAPPVTRTALPDGAPVVVETSTVVGPPWRGVFEHHPDARPDVSVPLVHVVSVADDAGEALGLFVVDATRRAFGDPERGWKAGERRVRELGSPGGAGIRTRQWDAGGYGISLTTVGLTSAEQRRLAGALELPDGPSLVHGRAPRLAPAVLERLGLAATDLRSGPAVPVGSHLIGQAGGASIDGLVHDGTGRQVLVSVVQDQLASAARVRRALAPHADVAHGSVPGAMAVAAVGHDGAAAPDGRVRGWHRVLVDHPAGVTVELSSDDLGVGELVALARTIDLQRLARTVVPLR